MVKVLLNLSIPTRWTHFSNILNPDIENSYCCSLLPSRRSQLWYWIELEVVSRNLMRLLAMKWLCQFPVLVSSYNGRIWNSKIHSAIARQRLSSISNLTSLVHSVGRALTSDCFGNILLMVVYEKKNFLSQARLTNFL